MMDLRIVTSSWRGLTLAWGFDCGFSKVSFFNLFSGEATRAILMQHSTVELSTNVQFLSFFLQKLQYSVFNSLV